MSGEYSAHTHPNVYLRPGAPSRYAYPNSHTTATPTATPDSHTHAHSHTNPNEHTHAHADDRGWRSRLSECL
jgi:hypothetical protein